MNASCALLNNGFMKIYMGIQPPNADTAISAATLLATLTFGATAFAASSGGVAMANAITGGVAVAKGRAMFYRLLKSDGTTAVEDGMIDDQGHPDYLMDNANIQAGQTVNVSSFARTQPKH